MTIIVFGATPIEVITATNHGLMSHQYEMKSDPPALVLAADIVSAYVGQNSMPPTEVPGFLKSVFDEITAIATRLAATTTGESQVPEMAITKSVINDRNISLEDGNQFKSLKRHLAACYVYSAKWRLPYDYPTAAPGDAATRSALTKGLGLDRKAGTDPASKIARPKAPANKGGRLTKAG